MDQDDDDFINGEDWYPILSHPAEIARFFGLVGIVFALWLLIYFVGPEAPKAIATLGELFK